MTWIESPTPEHECPLPRDADDWPEGPAPAFWRCPDCGDEWRVEVTQWTGWWASSYRNPGADEWIDCTPNVTMTPLRKDPNRKYGSIGFDHPRPGPRPEWLPPLPQPLRDFGRRASDESRIEPEPGGKSTFRRLWRIQAS